MSDLIHDLGPGDTDTEWAAAAASLSASDTVIAHIDTGLFPHPSLGYTGDNPPVNIQLDRGLNVYDPTPTDSRPVTDLSKSSGLVASAAEYPDHGVKTMSVILSDNEHLRGVAPGAKIIPYRIANGPVFLNDAKTSNIGRALNHALALPTPPKVISISMGNPGASGPFELLRFLTGGSPGMAKRTCKAINKAYEAGVIIVCAGGQIIDRVAYPAKFPRTIAVGGITVDDAHYPPGGYAEPGHIDVWARATHINRAAGLRVDGQIVPIHADTDHPDNDDNKPTGTSYACPQVAAAAAMWVTRYAAEFAGLEPWMITEAFRKALRNSADTEIVPVDSGAVRTVEIRRLNINKLMQTPPANAIHFTKARKAKRFLSWL